MKQRTKIALSGALLLVTGIAGITYFSQNTNTDYDATTTSVLPIKVLTAKSLETNPYMATSDVNIHHDCYNTDSTDSILPLGIYPMKLRIPMPLRLFSSIHTAMP